MKNYYALPIMDRLIKKIYAYGQTIWKDKWRDGIDNDWLNNYQNADEDIQYKEQLNMLYLLSKFMYFGHNELRQLLLSLYRDLFQYPIVAQIRKSNGDTIDTDFIQKEYLEELKLSRFLGVGNPSESGVHLLYYFRQECKLPKEYFINLNDIFLTTQVTEKMENGEERNYLKSEIANEKLKRYAFIDDFCGSGSQAKAYLGNIVKNIKFKNKNIEVNYLMLFGTERGIAEVKKLNLFNSVKAVFVIDDTFKAFSNESRYFFAVPDKKIDKPFSMATASRYGAKLFYPALGYGDCQLLLGLFHNTPDNSLPIFWSEENGWKPIFKRYHKF